MDLSHAPDKELRKAWLKRKFGSFEYHEELLKLHAQWYAVVRSALERPEVARDYPDLYQFFHETAFRNFDKVPKPGQLDPLAWEPGKQGGAARFIPDYREIMLPSYWPWMTKDEREAARPLWAKMVRMCLNIRQTVDKLWFSPRAGTDDSILDDDIIGSIDWPPNWRNDMADIVPKPEQEDAPISPK